MTCDVQNSLVLSAVLWLSKRMAGEDSGGWGSSRLESVVLLLSLLVLSLFPWFSELAKVLDALKPIFYQQRNPIYGFHNSWSLSCFFCREIVISQVAKHCWRFGAFFFFRNSLYTELIHCPCSAVYASICLHEMDNEHRFRSCPRLWEPWSNRQIWPWSTEWSRAKANRVLPRERTSLGHSKHPPPTT